MIVVGAGISGVAAARTVQAAGLDVVVLDRGRRVGGRMASRRMRGPRDPDRVVDTGASYFTVADPAFEVVARDWERRGLAHPWTDTFLVAHDGDLSPKPGPVRWSAPAGLRGLVEDLARDLAVREQTVQRVGPGPEVDGQAADAVLLAMPDPQARRLLDPTLTAEAAALDDPYEPVLALTARWADAAWPGLDGAFVAGDPILAWVADDGRRRGDHAPVLVAHSTPEFAAEHLEQPDQAAPLMVVAIRDALGIATEPQTTHVQRWTFARPAHRREQTYYLGEHLIGCCGDSWSDKPRVEAAYLSGVALGDALVERLG